MAVAARGFEGLHDFQSFTDQDPEDGSTKVKVESVQVREEGALILIRIVGSHFLWKMVRRMVGVLAEVGRGALGEADVARFLGARAQRRKARKKQRGRGPGENKLAHTAPPVCPNFRNLDLNDRFSGSYNQISPASE